MRGADGGEASTGIVGAGIVASRVSWARPAEYIARRASPAAERQLAVSDEGLFYCPGNVRLLHARAMALKTAGDLDAAREALEDLSRSHPDNAYTWHALGLLLQELNDFDGAIAAFERGAGAGRQGRAPNLVCLTAAAAAALHGGDLGRARRLFMVGPGRSCSPRHRMSFNYE